MKIQLLKYNNMLISLIFQNNVLLMVISGNEILLLDTNVSLGSQNVSTNNQSIVLFNFPNIYAKVYNVINNSGQFVGQINNSITFRITPNAYPTNQGFILDQEYYFTSIPSTINSTLLNTINISFINGQFMLFFSNGTQISLGLDQTSVINSNNSYNLFRQENFSFLCNNYTITNNFL
jgi:hypothetical protein